LKQELEKIGINYDDAMTRVMNNEAIYIRLLKKIPASVKSNNVMDSINAGDLDSAISKAHSLKGAMGNLSVTPLYEAYSRITQLLREGNTIEAQELLKQTLPIQNNILEFIEKI